MAKIERLFLFKLTTNMGNSYFRKPKSYGEMDKPKNEISEVSKPPTNKYVPIRIYYRDSIVGVVFLLKTKIWLYCIPKKGNWNELIQYIEDNIFHYSFNTRTESREDSIFRSYKEGLKAKKYIQIGKGKTTVFQKLDIGCPNMYKVRLSIKEFVKGPYFTYGGFKRHLDR